MSLMQFGAFAVTAWLLFLLGASTATAYLRHRQERDTYTAAVQRKLRSMERYGTRSRR